MIRRLLPSVLCIFLSPLLVAQQAGQVEENALGTAPTETLYAYRSSMNAADFTDGMIEAPVVPGSLYGLSVVPFELAVELTPVDAAAWASATIGSTLTFRVNRDVKADANAGDLIEATVIRMRQGKPRTRHGIREPRVKEVLVGKSVKLELEGAPRIHARFNSAPKNMIIWPSKVLWMIVFLPIEFVLLMIFCSTGCDL